MCKDSLQIDLSSETPAYRQIVDGLRAKLVAGVLRPGTRLPPVRQLALDLTVHHNTVAEAYRILAAEGWLDLRQGRGAIILDYTPAPASEADEALLARRIGELVVHGRAKGITCERMMQLFERALRNGARPEPNKETEQ